MLNRVNVFYGYASGRKAGIKKRGSAQRRARDGIVSDNLEFRHAGYYAHGVKASEQQG